MKAHRYSRNLFLFWVFIFIATEVLSAQEAADWKSWSSVSVNYYFTSKLRLRTKMEYRSKNDFSVTDRWNVIAGLHYKVLPNWEIKGSYELHHRKLANDVWKFRHRYNLGFQGSWKFDAFKLSWRERFQETVQGDNVENVLRSRVKLDYHIPQTCLQPHFSTEIFQRLDSSFADIFIVRYRPGLKIDFSDRYALVMFYCRQHEAKRNSNIVGVDMEINF